MKEVVYNIDEFKAKADLTKPVHHHGMYECKDPHDIVHWLTFRIYGISKNGNHVIVFEDLIIAYGLIWGEWVKVEEEKQKV